MRLLAQRPNHGFPVPCLFFGELGPSFRNRPPNPPSSRARTISARGRARTSEPFPLFGCEGWPESEGKGAEGGEKDGNASKPEPNRKRFGVVFHFKRIPFQRKKGRLSKFPEP